MPLLSLNNVSLTFAGPPLLDGASLQIEEGERIGLLGRNGAGKSTLLRMLAGSLTPDSGNVVRQPGLQVAGLPQEVPLDISGNVGLYLHEVCGAGRSEAAWEIESRIDRAVRELDLDLAADIETLSAGSKRRVLLAAALVRDPDLLILDEPTNHLDIEAIDHLEESLGRRRGALVFVTHDRSFLRHLATRILDLDRGALRSYRGSYDSYLETRGEERRAEAGQGAEFDRRLAREEAWLRQGIKARRTRNEGRVRRLEAMRAERGARRDEVGRVVAQVQEAGRSSQLVIRCRDLGYSWDEPIVRDFNATVLRGDRVGILGPNGCGKTTLLRLLLGKLAPQAGTVTIGSRLEVTHFEQLHDALDDTKSVFDNVAEGRESISIGGSERHVVGYLRDFLFTPDQIQGPVFKLSGGERRRLQLARDLSRPCNVLVLDEPTNDLDLETLELLEELLLEFPGTLLVVSHDRAFLDNVVTSTFVSEGRGRWGEYVGGYEDWLRQRPAEEPAAPVRPSRPVAARATVRPRRLTFREKQELVNLPVRIDALEAERAELFELMASPSFHTRRGDEVSRARERLTAIEAEIETAFTRWQELESLAAGDAK